MSTLRELQLFELQMLKDFAKVCSENNIEYIIASGTLLGAVRHKGFIPWDDDIDVYMTVKNYNRFCKIGQKALGDNYFIQNYKTDKFCNLMWTQVRANGTTSMPLKLKDWDIHWGISFDVFPIVGVSSDPKKKLKQKNALAINRMLLSDCYMIANGEPFTKKLKIIYTIPRCLRRLICRINEKRYMFNHEKYDKCANVWYDITVEYPSDLFQPLIEIEFENETFTTMKNYDKYLSILYGDYMTPPPENERSGHDLDLGKMIFDTKKSYLEYKVEV